MKLHNDLKWNVLAGMKHMTSLKYQSNDNLRWLFKRLILAKAELLRKLILKSLS